MDRPSMHGGTALPATPQTQQALPAAAPIATRSQSTYMHADRRTLPPTTCEQSLQNHHYVSGSGQPGAESVMSASMAVSHLRRTRSDHVMSSRSRESSNSSRADSPRRTGDDVYDLLANMKKRITDNLLGLGSPFGRRRERRPSEKDGGGGSTPTPSSPARTGVGNRNDTNGDSPDLEGFEFVENIELNHMDGFVVGGKKEAGRGHCFQPIQLAAPTWCDQCGDFIWGVYKQCLKCKYCEYTCHHKCRQMVSLDCFRVTSDARSHNETSLVERSAKAKIYSGSTVVYSKRRSLQEESQDSGHTPPPCAQSPEDLFTKLQEEEKLKDQGVPRPPLVPEYAWNTLRQVAPTQTEAETSFNDRCSDEYGSIRFDTVRAFVLEDDADSGYHTGESTLCGGGGAPTTAPPPPGERTLSREDLKRRIEAFNDNQHGLLMTLRETSDTFQGFIRVYMNLMRPISMSLTARPPSIYDILTPDVNDPDEYESDTQLTSFYLPKDTTKVIHITSDTTAQEVIRALLQKFRITDNPRKFALYERLDEGHSKSTMRRLRDDECPLPLCLCWTAEGLNFHRFILQENDTGEIQWEAFSIPELDNFLRILDKEEDEYVDQVKAKYQLMKIQMVQHMKHLDQQRIQSKDQRTPVFV